MSIDRAIGHALTFLILTAMFAVAARARSRVDVMSGARVLRYPFLMKGVALLGCAGSGAFLSFAVLSLRGPTRPPLWVIGLFLTMLVVSVLSAIEMTWNGVEWTEYEIVQRSPWTGEKRILWTDVESVAYSSPNRWFVVTSRLRTKVRVHELMGGMDELSDAFRGHLSPEVLRRAEKGMDRHRRPGR